MNPDWIALDWGTSKLRAWAMAADGTVLAEDHSDLGMINVPAGGFEMALLASIDEWLPEDRETTVIAAGMVGARQGWQEVPYRDVPCSGFDAEQMVRVGADDPRLDLRILPGLRQLEHPDVMRGEETQIFGFLSENPEFEGLICLPGTHSKWVQVSGGAIHSFTTFMTGEMFAWLSEQSILRHSMSGGWDDAAFLSGVSDGFSQPGRLTANLFGIRTASLLGDAPEGAGIARLSGMLIGTEIAAAQPGDQPVALIGGTGVTTQYAAALRALDCETTTHDAGVASRNGLQAAYRAVQETA